MITAIIFDMDGTMIDTEKIKENGWKYAGECLGITIDNEIMSKIRGTNRQYIKEFLNERFQGLDFEKLCRIRDDFIDDYIKENGIQMKKGLMELLDFLKSNHYKVAVASSSEEKNIKENLEKIGVLHFCDAVIGGNMVNHSKPDPEIYLKAADMINVLPEQCIGIEDSANGILSVYRAGMKAVMIPDLDEPKEETERLLYAKLDSLIDVIDLLKNIK